ncbi:MAG: long-chain fatty acid--CoA ligase [Bacillota bacterium]|nr:long-chain fatty acid--CoA ligase [Bacillota bacterium]
MKIHFNYIINLKDYKEEITIVARPWFKHVVKGNPTEIEIPEISLPQMLKKTVAQFKDNIAISFYDKTFTYGQFYHIVQRVASAFNKLGVKKGDRVALMLPNCPQYPISYYAALQCGAIVVQVNPMYRANELVHTLNDSGTKLIIAYDKVIPVIEAIKDKTPLETVLSVSFEDPTCSFNSLLQDVGDQIPQVDLNPKEDVAILQYTGGTTGRSKGAMLTHYNVVANTMQSAATSHVNLTFGAERILTIVPLFHVLGMTVGMNMAVYLGSNLILLPKFEVEEVLEAIKRHRPSNFPGVPTMYIALLNHPKLQEVDMTCFRTMTCGSAPLPVEVLNHFNSKSGAQISEGFGLSEASPVTHRNPCKGLQKPGSVGIPIPNTDAKIVDIATGIQEMPVNEVGELVIKGPQIMKGYWQKPEETASAIRDGWLYTGDLAMMDEDGFFFIVGRKKELIIASGFNVYPVEVEEVLYTYPKVLEAAVIGVPHPYRGETVKAYIVLKDGEEATAEEIIAFCKKHLATFKVPELIEFRQEMPKSTVGKILKKVLKEQLEENQIS